MTVLVTGASGFVGSLLVPRLQASGVPVRAAARNPARIEDALQATTGARRLRGVTLARIDALTGAGLGEALADVEVAYYLIHSMERSSDGPGTFAERDRRAAENFAAAARRAGVGRIVYLGGLLPQRTPGMPRSAEQRRTSRHLASREQVEQILRASVPETVALRASIVIGARSRSFRLLVRLVERMPVLTLPAWRRFRTQPIDERDVVEMLLACARAPVGGQTLDAGGPEVMSYGEMLERIADIMLVGRPAIGLGVSLTPLTARVVAAIVDEDPELVLPLMEGLDGDLLPSGQEAAERLGVRLHTFRSSVEHALAEWERREELAAR